MPAHSPLRQQYGGERGRRSTLIGSPEEERCGGRGGGIEIDCISIIIIITMIIFMLVIVSTDHHH